MTNTLARFQLLALQAIFAFALAISLAIGAATTAYAQATEAPNYQTWDVIAGLAEDAAVNADTSERVLNSLRGQIVDLRTQFQAATENQDVSIADLRDQIAALGPVPEEGVTEAEDITQRRQQLNQLLAERQAPLLAAQEAHARAEAIIRAIDRQLRSRQASELLEMSPSPLNPANWLAAANTLVSSLLTLQGETYNAWLSPEKRAQLRSELPLVIGLLAVAGLLLLRGRAWMERLTHALQSGRRFVRGRNVMAFFVSLTQLLLPFIGLSLLSQAILVSQLTGVTTSSLAWALVPAGMAVYGARWLSLHIFMVNEDQRSALNLSAALRKKARGIALMMGALCALYILFDPLFAPQSQEPGAIAVLKIVLIVLVSYTLLRMAHVLKRHVPRTRTIEDQTVAASPFFDRMLRLGARVLSVMAIAAPLIGLAGYVRLAEHMAFPTVYTLGLSGLMIVLHRLVTAIYGAILGDVEAAADGLVPALAGLVLSLIALPLLALIWGARQTDLSELWTRFSEGVTLGETQISPVSILSFFVIFAIGYLLTRAFQGALGSSVLPKTSMEPGAQKAIVSGVGYVGITLAALVAFSTAGIDLSGLAIVAGALSVGIGFGLQNIVSNFVSGIILLIERPVSEGDWVEVGATSGIIQRISVRSTMIQAFDRSKVIVPNSDLISGAVTNYTKSTKTGRLIVPFGVAYGSDTRKVAELVQDIVMAQPLVVLDPGPSVLLMRFGADAIEFEARMILSDVNFKLSVLSEVNHQIAQCFAENSIEIPYAQRDIWLRNPEALVGPQKRDHDSSSSNVSGSGFQTSETAQHFESSDFAEGDTPT